jgi:hypothetical protein
MAAKTDTVNEHEEHRRGVMKSGESGRRNVLALNIEET